MHSAKYPEANLSVQTETGNRPRYYFFQQNNAPGATVDFYVHGGYTANGHKYLNDSLSTRS